MRLRLVLEPRKSFTKVPINYQYPLSAAIYKILQQASPEYAEFLHNRGYSSAAGRLMKLFTFSKLRIPGGRLRGRALTGSRGGWQLQIGSPMHDEFVQNFVLGLFETAQLTIAAAGIRGDFQIQQVEALAPPAFENTMRFKCLSPLVVSTMHEHKGRLTPYYLRPDDAGLSEALRRNLEEKHKIIHGPLPEKPDLFFEIQKQDKPRSKLITIKEGTPSETQIKAFETYFTLKGSPEMMQTAWECGLGEHNSQGFGMIEAVERRA